MAAARRRSALPFFIVLIFREFLAIFWKRRVSSLETMPQSGPSFAEMLR